MGVIECCAVALFSGRYDWVLFAHAAGRKSAETENTQGEFASVWNPSLCLLCCTAWPAMYGSRQLATREGRKVLLGSAQCASEGISMLLGRHLSWKNALSAPRHLGIL